MKPLIFAAVIGSALVASGVFMTGDFGASRSINFRNGDSNG